MQADNFSWFGFPDDTEPSARNLFPGLAKVHALRVVSTMHNSQTLLMVSTCNSTEACTSSSLHSTAAWAAQVVPERSRT